MGDKNNWLQATLTRIENKLEVVEQTQTDLIKNTALNYQAYKGLYSELEGHKIGKCGTMVLHEDAEHKGLAGKILGYVIGVVALLSAVVGGLLWLFTELRK